MQDSEVQHAFPTRRLIMIFLAAFLSTMMIVIAVGYLIVLATGLFSGAVMIGLVVCSALVIGIAMLRPMWKCWRQYRAGSAALARGYGAHQIKSNAGYESDDRLAEIVAGVASSLGVEVPSIWLRHSDPGINVFSLCAVSPSASASVSDSTDDVQQSLVAMVLTRGVLDRLTHDELRALIEHGFALGLDGDISSQTRLLVPLSGVLSMDTYARQLLSRDRSSFGGFVSLCTGCVVRVMSLPGLLGARLIRSSASPARIYSADASAVKVTRKTESVLSLLHKAMQAESAELQKDVCMELDHLSFQTPTPTLVNALAGRCHPRWSARLLAIDPDYMMPVANPPATVPVDAAQNDSRALDIGPEPATDEENIGHSGYSDRIELFVADPLSSLATIFAMFVPGNELAASEYYQGIAFAYQQPFARRVAEIRQGVGYELDTHAESIVDLVVPMLVDVKLNNKRLALFNLEKLIRATNDLGVRNFLLLQHLRHRLDCDFVTLDSLAGSNEKATGSKLKDFSEIPSEIGLLISLLVEATGQAAARQDREYKRILAAFTNHTVPRRSQRDKNILHELEVAFNTLVVQPMTHRQRIYEQCTAALRFEGSSELRHRPLLQLFAAAIRLSDVPGSPAYDLQFRAA